MDSSLLQVSSPLPLLALSHPLAGVAPFVFFLLAALLVSVCRYLVTQASEAVEPLERQAAFLRVATGIGSLVWVLDVVGMTLYDHVGVARATLWPAMLALCIMLVSARLSIPALADTRRRRTLVVASAGLATGVVIGHIALLAAVGIPTGALHWAATAVSILVATGLCVFLSLRQRTRRLQMPQGQRLTFAVETLAAGAVIVYLHGLLLLAVQAEPGTGAGVDGELAALLVLTLFAVLIAVEQVFGLRVDAMRQRLFDHAVSRPRTAHPKFGSQDHKRLSMIAERIEALLGQRHLRLHFQPIAPVREPEAPVRFEALLRLHDGDLGRIDPEQFFVACERMNRTAFADRRIIRHALDCSAEWLRADCACAGVSVNVSHETLLEDDFVAWLRNELAGGSWPYGWLQLEITEHAMITHAERLGGVLRQLRTLGVGVVMDDFGAGYSSLGTLVELPIEGIKCDRTLVRALADDPARQTLLQHVCALARELGLSVTVEGVETHADLDIVRGKGACTVQGYVFARPMAHGDVPAWLRERNADGMTAVAQPA